MRIGVLVALLCTAFPLAARAQDRQPTLVQKTRVDPKALEALDAMMARYGELKSYSDKCQVKLDNAEKWPKEQRERMTFSGSLAFERPDKLRFEGTTPKGAFLLVNDGTTTRVLNPENPGKWIERPQGSPLNVRIDFERSNVRLREGEPVPIDGGWQDAGPILVAEGLIFRPQVWQSERNLVAEVSFGADEMVNGEECRMLKLGNDYGTGEMILSRLWIAKSDGLLRRFERLFGEGADTVSMIETHSEVRSNPELESKTWEFAAPDGAEVTDRFPDSYPIANALKIKVGDAMPVFSQDGINGEAVELNPKAGAPTIVYFFFANIAASDGASLQRLQTALGADKLQVVATAGDTNRERVQALIAKNGFEFPIYFDDKAYKNQLAGAMGVRGWPLVLLFDREAKLRTVTQRPGDEEFVQALRQQFPDVPEQTIVDALMGPPQPAP